MFIRRRELKTGVFIQKEEEYRYWFFFQFYVQRPGVGSRHKWGHTHKWGLVWSRSLYNGAFRLISLTVVTSSVCPNRNNTFLLIWHSAWSLEWYHCQHVSMVLGRQTRQLKLPADLTNLTTSRTVCHYELGVYHFSWSKKCLPEVAS